MPKETVYDANRSLSVHWSPQGDEPVGLVTVIKTPDDPKTIEWGVAVWTSTPEDLYRLEKAIRRARRSLDKKLTRKAAEYLESKIVFKNPER